MFTLRYMPFGASKDEIEKPCLSSRRKCAFGVCVHGLQPPERCQFSDRWMDAFGGIVRLLNPGLSTSGLRSAATLLLLAGTAFSLPSADNAGTPGTPRATSQSNSRECTSIPLSPSASADRLDGLTRWLVTHLTQVKLRCHLDDPIRTPEG